MLLRPHKYQIAEPLAAQEANNGLDENGYVVGVTSEQGQPDPEWGEEIECRYDSGKNTIRPIGGGEYMIFKYVVYCDPIETNLMGKMIRLLDQSGQVVYEGMVDDQRPGQLHITLYLK